MKPDNIKQDFLVNCMNIRSLIKNKDELEELIIKEKNPSIIALTETRITNDIDDDEISIPNYYILRCDSNKRSTGGVLLYIKNDIKCKEIVNRKIVDNCWSVGMKVSSDIFKGVILVNYHSPSASDADFIYF